MAPAQSGFECSDYPKTGKRRLFSHSISQKKIQIHGRPGFRLTDKPFRLGYNLTEAGDCYQGPTLSQFTGKELGVLAVSDRDRFKEVTTTKSGHIDYARYYPWRKLRSVRYGIEPHKSKFRRIFRYIGRRYMANLTCYTTNTN